MGETAFWIALVSMFGAVGGPYLTFRVMRARYSGRVNTTDADALWKEAADLRRQYQTEISELRRALEETKREHNQERVELLAEIDRLRAELRERNDRIEHLETDRIALTRRVTELEGELRRRAEAAAAAVTSLPAGGAR